MGDRGDQGRPGDPDTPVTHQTLASHNTRDAGLILILIKAFNHRDITINYSLKSSMPCRFKLLLRESLWDKVRSGQHIFSSRRVTTRVAGSEGGRVLQCCSLQILQQLHWQLSAVTTLAQTVAIRRLQIWLCTELCTTMYIVQHRTLLNSQCFVTTINCCSAK